MTSSFKENREVFAEESEGYERGSKDEEISIPLKNLAFDSGLPFSDEVRDSRAAEWSFPKKTNPIKRFFQKCWYGPDEPLDERPHFSRALLSYLDEYPQRSFEARFPRSSVRNLLLIVYMAVWLGIVASLLYPHLVRAPSFYSNNDKSPILTLKCDSYLNWAGTNNACGLNAEKCGPFSDKEYYIRCPALCDRGGWTYSGIAVGDQRIKYTGYEIGGGRKRNKGDINRLSNPYRADSFPCAAAIHAGVISRFSGGCAKLSMDGPQTSFKGTRGKMGQHSVQFDSFFPASFSFRSLRDGIAAGCYDPRVLVVTLNVIFAIPVFFLYESIIGYWIISLVGYWTVILALDPPVLSDPYSPESVYELISVAFQRLLPLCFVLYVVWKCASKRTLEDGSPVLKIFLWYPTFWLGIMNNITFDRLPVDRLTAHDLREQSGAIIAVGSIATTIFVCAIIEAYALWKSGRFQKYLKIYISIIGGLVFLGAIPGLTLRVHHYILGLILIPGCATRGASAYLFQGILLGLFISGVSRWDFASIVETDFSLLRGEAGISLKPPMFDFDDSFKHIISWQMNPDVTDVDPTGNIDGFSLLINDFEVYVGKNQSLDLDLLISDNQVLSSMIDESLQTGSVKLYMRVAQASTRNPETNRGDYTNAGVLEWPQGIWHDPMPGVS